MIIFSLKSCRYNKMPRHVVFWFSSNCSATFIPWYSLCGRRGTSLFCRAQGNDPRSPVLSVQQERRVCLQSLRLVRVNPLKKTVFVTIVHTRTLKPCITHWVRCSFFNFKLHFLPKSCWFSYLTLLYDHPSSGQNHTPTIKLVVFFDFILHLNLGCCLPFYIHKARVFMHHIRPV
jgi:hypothetical protein